MSKRLVVTVTIIIITLAFIRSLVIKNVIHIFPSSYTNKKQISDSTFAARNFSRNTGNSSHDDTLPSEDPPKKIRILCWVMTSIENLDIRAIYVKKTWGKRCDILLFASDIENKTFGTIDINPGTGRQNLPNKTQEAFDYIYAHHIDDSDWFLKCDDDTYVIMENLRYFLSPLDTTVPLFFGHHFIGEGGYFSGGAGYVLSKEALTRYGQRDKSLRACSTNFIAEDVMMGSCLKGLGVHLGDSHDTYNKSRFHCFTPQEHIKGDYYPWYLRYDSQGAKHGVEWMSDYPISFHYMKPEMMYFMEYVMYHARPYGIRQGMEEINKINVF